METFDSLEDPLCDYNESMDALPELWEPESFESSIGVEFQETESYQQSSWPTGLSFSLMSTHNDSNEDLATNDNPSMVVLHDRLITDATVSTTIGLPKPLSCNSHSQVNSNLLVRNESGSSKKQADSFSITIDCRGEVEISEDLKTSSRHMRNQFCDPLSLNIKAEPTSPSANHISPVALSDCYGDPLPESRKRSVSLSSNQHVRDRYNTKVKPTSGNSRLVVARMSSTCSVKSAKFLLPPTPPSSTSSDSEGNLSPLRDAVSPKLEAGEQEVQTRRVNQAGRALLAAKSLSDTFGNGSNRHPINSPLISYQPKGSIGALQLTEEEKRTLLAEGYSVPTRLPLTKAEEKSLKKIRRKIKNKISAQESRRKKKEYMDTLERRAQVLAEENNGYRQRLQKLESDNAALQLQLMRLNQLLNKQSSIVDINCYQIDQSSSVEA